MKRRAGALLMALALVMTSITPYAEEMTVETYSEESTEVSTETVAETLPEEESQAEEIPVPEVEVGTGETLEEGSSEEESSPEETPAEEISEEEPVTYSEEPVTEESEEETETETETESEEESDPNADVETAADWEATLPSLTGVWGDDIVRVAQSQLGYTESTRNFEKVENATAEPGSETASNKKGYTRYGAWYGSPYEDWCAMFASFCLYYAGVPTSVMPEDSGVVSWIQTLQYDGIYAEKSTAYQPVSGDLIFFAMGSQGADHVGIIESTVTAVDENGKSYVAGIYTIEGNSGNAVRENYYDVSDSRILGYGVLSGQPGIDEETADEWEATLPALTGELANDVTLVAESQLGYTESSRNFTFSSDWSKKGYTRYGAWYGEPYADWSTMFVSFCLTYAESGLTPAGSAAGLIDVMKAADLYEDADYVPSAGDIVFLSKEGDGADASAVIERVDTAFDENGNEAVVSLSVIEGDGNDAVREATYSAGSIVGYAKIAGEKWDGFFDAEQPELGGIIVAQIAGELGGTVTAEIPAGAFDEMVTLSAEAAVYAPEDADSDLLDAVLAAAGKTEEDPVYDLYVIDIAFINGDGEEVEPAAAVSIAVDTSKAPVDISAGEADAEKLEKGIYHINNESGAADAIGSVVLLNEDNDLTGLAFESDMFSPFAVLVADAEAEKIYTAEDGGVQVTVTAPAGALPADAELQVILYAEDSAEYEEAAEIIGADVEAVSDEETEDTGVATLAGYGAAEETENESKNLAVMDIKFVSDGEEVEPAEAVSVVIDASALMPEDVDESTIEVQHLVEAEDGEVTSVVVAGETAVAEFEVESFSVFTITWDDGTGTTIEVHVYSMNGTSIDEELDETTYSSTNSVITISDLVSHLQQNASYTNTYTYRYATVVYETLQGGGYSSTTIGGEDNSVASISKGGTTYTVTTSSGTTTVTDPADIVIHLYYSIPTVTLTTEDPYEETVHFTTSSNYFVGDTGSATYTWALSDDTLGTLVHPTSGEATFTWSDSAQSGDQVTVTVTMTVGEETASDTYTLTYGVDPVTFTVYSQDGTTPQANARVALVDASGNTVATGTTGDDGTVTLYAPAGTYTVGVTYVYLVSEAGGGSTSRATAETTITVSDDQTATGSVTLGTAVTSGPGGNTSGSNGGGSEPYYYEHIDVKVAAAETSDSDVSFSDLDAVYVYDKYGNLLYVSEDINSNPGTTDYNVLFDINANEDQHSIVVSSEDTIVLVYEVKDNETGEYSTYTVSYRSGETYPADEYYPYTAVNAYQLYNILYNANYASQEAFEAAWGPSLEGYNEAGISISGYSYTLIADYLCDTRTTTGQAGLDFVIYVQELEATQDDFDFRVAKTVENVPDTLGADDIENFTFTLQELGKVQDDGEWTEAIWSTEDGNVLSTDTDTISSFTQNSDGTWSGILDFLGALTYEAEDGTNFYYYILSEQTPTTATPTQQYYGLKVTVTYTAATGVATIVVSYCTLGTQDDYPYYRTSGWTGLTAYTDTDDDGDEYTYYSIPFVNTYSTTGFDLGKVDDIGVPLDGAVFTMTTTQIEGEGTTLYFTSETVDGTLVYTLASSTTEGASTDIAVTNGGPVSIQGIAAGTYTLSETTVPNGYIAVDDFTVTIDGEGNVTVSGDNVSVAEGTDTVTVTDLEATSITVTKTWADNNNAYTTRPESVTVTITGNDDSTYTLTLNDDNNWAATQDNLPKTTSDGTEIIYTVTEETVDGYTGTVVDNNDGTYTITNTLTGTTEISVEKKWVDSDNTYNTRPGSITVTITGSDGNTYTMTLSDSNDWSDSNNELPLYDSTGTQITYTVTEETVNGYTGTVTDNGDGTYTITNTLETVDIEGSKTWASDSDNKYNTRPTSITINLLADGTTLDSVTVTADDNWSWSFKDLPKYQSDGTTEVKYTITEDTVPGYTTEVSDYDVTNTLVTTEVSGKKTWVGDTEDDRPDSITIYLYADGVQTGDTAVVTSADNWAWTFTNLPKYQSDGTTEIVYTIMEGETEEGHLGEYIPSYSEGGLSVTNAIPEVSKYVSDPAYGEDVDDELDEDEADNNDTLEYEIKAEHVGNAQSLVFHDLLDNHLDISTLEIESVTLYEDEEDEGTALVAGTDYTYTTDTCGGTDCNMDGCSFEIKILDDDLAGLGSDAYIVIIFDITLKENVEDFDDNYVEETDNWANISFFSYYATPVEVETYSYGFDLFKYTGSDEALAGAEFILSKDGDDGTVYAQFDVSDGRYLLTGWVSSQSDATAIVSGSDGNAVVEGLHDGTFTIEETKAPEGYQKESGTMTVTITVDEDDPTNPTITATNATVDGSEVKIPNEPEDETETETEPDDSTKPKKTVDVGNGTEVSIGEKLTYTISFYNYYDEAVEVTVTDELDSGLDFVSASDDGAYNESTHTITWTVVTPAHSEGEVSFVAIVNENAGSQVVNDADVQIWNDSVVTTNKVENPLEEEETPEEPGIPKDPTKAVDIGNGTTTAVGQELTYTITYYNHYAEAVDVTISDLLDTGLEFVSASNGGTYDATTRTVSWTIKDAAPVAYGSVTLTVKVTEDALTTGSVENVATVRIGNDDAVGTNLVSNPVVEEGSDSVKTGDTTPLGPVAGIMAMALALLTGTAVYRRRRAAR